MTVKHLTKEELEAGLKDIMQSPKDNGVIEMIVCRPEVDERDVLEIALLDLDEGLVGDSWKARGSTATPDGSAHPDAQINIMNSRAIALLAQEKERWSLAGDQFFIDLDLGVENLPAGTRLAIGSAILEVTDHGVGMSADELEGVFQPFRGSFGKGTGLGLAIVHRIVSDSGGRIEVQSEPERGTTFIIRLPALAGGADGGDTPRARPAPVHVRSA